VRALWIDATCRWLAAKGSFYRRLEDQEVRRNAVLGCTKTEYIRSSDLLYLLIFCSKHERFHNPGAAVSA
jgi:hypothetical protein